MTENVRNPLERACDAAGRALRGTHDSLRDSSECSFNDAFILLDKHLNFVKMNHVARKMFGQFVGDVMGKNILDVFPDIKETERYYEYHRVMKTGEPFFADNFAPSSQFGDVRLSVKAFKVGNGLGFVVSDLTERKRLKTRFAESEAKYQALVENSTDGIAISRGGQVIYANKVALEIFGFKTVEEIRKGSFLDMVVPEDMAFIEERIEKRLRGEPVESKFEVRILRGDGKVRDIEIYTSEIALNGEKFVQSIYRDITERRKMEEALRQSEEKLRGVLDSSVDMIYRANLKTGTYDYVSPAAEKVIGYLPEELTEMGLMGGRSLAHPDDLDRLDQNVIDLVMNGGNGEIPSAVEYRFKHKKLGYRWMYDNRSVVCDSDGTPVAVVGIFRDITERKQLEEVLRESEERYKALVEAVGRAGEGIIIVQDKEGREGAIVFANDEICRMSDYSRDELLNMTYLDFATDFEFGNELAERYRKRQQGEDVTACYEVRVTRRDGGVLFIELSLALMSWQGKAATVAYVRDITERKQVEDALKEAEQKFRAIFDNANDGFISVEPESRKFFNPNRKMIEMLGYNSVDEVTNLTVPDIHPKQVIPYILNDFEKHVRREVSHSEDIPVQRKDGSVFIASINSYEVTIANKKYLSCIFRDITERRKAEDALRRSEEYFHSLTDNAVDVILVIGADGVRKYVSPSIERVRGYKPEELIGKEAIEGVHPDDVPKIADIFVQLTENPGNFLQWECRLRHKDGTWHIVEGISRNLFDNPVVAGIVSNFRDITERREAEDVLRKSESKYRQLIESMYEGLWVIDKDARTTLVNPRMAEILGYSMEEMQGKSLLYFMDEDAVKSATFYLKHREQGIKEQHNFEFIRKDGAKVYTRLETAPIVDDEGVYNGAIAYVSDISGLKKAEYALRESEAKFRTVLENSVDVIYQVNLKTGMYDYFSPSLVKLLGYMPEEIMALTVEKAFPIVHPDDLAGVRKYFKQLVASAKPGDKTPAIEYRVKHKESGYRCVIDSSSMLFDEHGNAAAIVGTVHDITERRKAEDELWRTRERLQRMFDSVEDGICVTDMEGRIVDVNPRGLKMYGASTKEELIGKSAYDLIVSGEQEKTAGELKSVLERGTTGLVEHKVVRADGSVYLAELTASMLKDISGNPTGFVAVLRDITERRKAENALKESEEKYRALVDTAGLAGEGIMIVERDAEGKAVVAFANETLARMLGYKTEEMIGMMGRELFLPGDRVLLHEKHRRRQKGEKLPSHSGVMALRKDGSLLPIELSMGAMNLNGKPATVVYVRDVTDRKAAEEALRQSETQFRAIFENAAVGVGIVDSHGRPLKINPAFEKMIGYTLEELRQTPFKTFMHPDDAFSDAKLFTEMAEGKRNQYVFDKRYIRKDGQIVWGRLTLSAVRDAKGKLSFAVGMVEDITESKMALEKLQRSEEHFRALTENAMDAICVINRDGTIRYESPSWEHILGYKVEERIGQNPLEIVHPEDLPMVMEEFSQTLGNPGRIVKAEVRARHKSGAWRTIEFVGRNLLDDPAVEGIVANVRDITERKLAEEERVKHTRRVEALHDIAQAASQTLELEELLNLALGKTLEVMEADLGGIYLMDVLEKELVLRASKGLPEDVVERISSIKLGTRKIQEIQKWAEGSLPLEGVFGDNVRGRVSKAIEKAQIKSYAVVPFFIRGQLYGLVAVGTRIRREFSAADIDLLKDMANQIGIGTHNAILYEEVRALIRETLDAQEQERERICLDVHDGVAQTLVAAFQYLQSLEVISPDEKDVRGLIAKATVQVKKAIQESREVINSLQPATLREVGLVPTLRHEMKRLEQETGLKVNFKADDIRLPKDIETGLYRIIHEAVFNARKHSNTKRLRVCINSVNGLIKVEVKDWGKGFTQARLDSSKRRGTGLFSIRKRTELMKGVCDIKSAPGQGTTVYVEIPFTPAKE